jgi:hypothetical protein
MRIVLRVCRLCAGFSMCIRLFASYPLTIFPLSPPVAAPATSTAPIITAQHLDDTSPKDRFRFVYSLLDSLTIFRTTCSPAVPPTFTNPFLIARGR